MAVAKPAPTLADAIMREWSRPTYRRIDPGNKLVTAIGTARKFVLDDGTSALLADLAYHTLQERTANIPRAVQDARACALMDTMRALSRLPHKTTWIEFNFRARAERAIKEYGAGLNLAMIPDRGGWLLMQHPTLETAFMSIECTSHSWNDKVREATPHAGCFATTWRVDDGPPPWPKLDLGYEHPEGLLTGITSYRSDSVGITWPFHLERDFVRHYLAETKFDPVQENSSCLRYMWALLSTINDLPVTTSQIVAAKGYVTRGRYRKFVDHTVVTLTIPTRQYRKVAAQLIAMVRRRAHEVRGHWRKDWRRPPSPLCDHQWEGGEHDAVCRVCDGRRTWIKEHQRGDASLGIVTHDYVVEREPQP